MADELPTISKEKKLTPCLRFPWFSGEWKEKKLGDVYTFKNGINAEKGKYGQWIKFINVLDIINNAFITYEKILWSVDVDKNTIDKNTVQYGDMLFQRSSETREEVGQSNVYVDKKTAVFWWFVIRWARKTKNNPIFMNIALKSSKIRKDITSRSWGSTRYNIWQDALQDVVTYLPTLPEQQKIANFLTAVDGKIAQLTQLKAERERYKRAVIQGLFMGKLRFPWFEGEWEEMKLGECLRQKSTKNKNCKVDLVLSVSNKKGFITQDEQFDWHQVASQDVSNYKIVNKWDFAYNPSRINVGSLARLTGFEQGIVSPMYVVFSVKNNLHPVFLENLLTTHKIKHLIKIWCSWSVRDSLNFEDMCNFIIQLPSLPEQEKIANYLSSIDNKIEKITIQLDEIQQWKKGLLQGLFI